MAFTSDLVDIPSLTSRLPAIQQTTGPTNVKVPSWFERRTTVEIYATRQQQFPLLHPDFSLHLFHPARFSQQLSPLRLSLAFFLSHIQLPLPQYTRSFLYFSQQHSCSLWEQLLSVPSTLTSDRAYLGPHFSPSHLILVAGVAKTFWLLLNFLLLNLGGLICSFES